MKDDLPAGARDLGEWCDEFIVSLPWRYRLYAIVLRLWWKVAGRPECTITDAVIPSSKGSSHEG